MKFSVVEKRSSIVFDRVMTEDAELGMAENTSRPQKDFSRFNAREKRALTYTDLLPLAPTALKGVDDATAGERQSTSSSPLAMRSYDDEGAAFSMERKTRNLMPMQKFSRELAERISVPRSFIQLVGTGQAYLRYHKKGDGWRITTVTGNRFLRAAIFDVVEEFRASRSMNDILSKLDYPSIRIYFSYTKKSAMDQTVKPIEIRTEANKIFLVVTHKVASPLWNLGMAVDSGNTNAEILPNLIGIGSLFLDSVSGGPPFEDNDVARLRQSPAFIRSIGL